MRHWDGQRCQRCGKQSAAYIMSMYNEQMICMACKDNETKREDYSRAQDADVDAIRQGNFNFKGIGLK